MKNCIYAGVFDPPHSGHKNIIDRLLGIFDGVTVTILCNAEKSPKLNSGARARLIQTLYAGEPRVKVRVFDGMLTDFAEEEKTYVIARGIRDVGDLEYERRLREVYKSQKPEIEVLYLAAEREFGHISSGVIKELIALGGDISGYVPAEIFEEILRSYK